MTERLLTEARLSLTLLAREQNVSIPTLWRWCQRGIRGHVLESFVLGGRRYTTRQAFGRWIALTNGEKVVANETPAKQRARANSATAKLAKIGVM